MGEAANLAWYGNFNVYFAVWCTSVLGLLSSYVTGGRYVYPAVATTAIGSALYADYELYYIQWCPLPTELLLSNEMCATELMAGLERANVTWWVDFGSLIAFYRKNGLMAWDDDFDTGVEGVESRVLAAALTKHVKGRVTFDDDVVQLHCAKTHADVFLWRVNGTRMTQTHTSTVNNRRSTHDMFPLRRISWLGVVAYTPQNGSKILSGEYGPRWKLPRITHRECINMYRKHAGETRFLVLLIFAFIVSGTLLYVQKLYTR